MIFKNSCGSTWIHWWHHNSCLYMPEMTTTLVETQVWFRWLALAFTSLWLDLAVLHHLTSRSLKSARNNSYAWWFSFTTMKISSLCSQNVLHLWSLTCHCQSYVKVIATFCRYLQWLSWASWCICRYFIKQWTNIYREGRGSMDFRLLYRPSHQCLLKPQHKHVCNVSSILKNHPHAVKM